MDIHDKQRRNLLRGALYTGIVVAAPVLFTGCDSKQETANADTDDSKSSAKKMAQKDADQADAQTPQKLSKAKAGYRDSPNNTEQCSNCMNFIADSNSCKLVDGQISPDGWCSLWAKK